MAEDVGDSAAGTVPVASDLTEQSRLEFEQAIHGGGSPRIEAHLARASTGDDRRELLAVLLRAELAHRRACGEVPTPEDYLDRFPAEARVVDEAFLMVAGHREELTEGSDSERTESKGSPSEARLVPIMGVGSGEDEPPVIPGSLLNELGTIFPHLEILEPLKKGGMGAVFKARQIKLDRLVALKIIGPSPSNEDKFAERFLREARALARMKHGRIVTIYDYGESQGIFFILMEFIEGQDLREALAPGPLEPQRALELTVQICEALEYAHGQGVAHRDLKPANVLIDPRRGAILADFGLVKILQGEARDPELTSSFVVLGTPNYMAPEQYSDPRTVDHRADIYALGVVLYEMLTGRRPRGIYEPVSELLGIDPEIDGILRQALRSDPAERLSSASELRSLLTCYARDRLPPGETTLEWPDRQVASSRTRALDTSASGQPHPVTDSSSGPTLRTWGRRGLAIGLAVALAAAVVHGSGPPFPYRLYERSDREIRVNVPEFKIRNQTQTSNARQAAADKVPPFMVNDPAPIKDLADRLDDLTVSIAGSKRFEDVPETVRSSWKLKPESYLDIKAATETPERRGSLHAQLQKAFIPLMANGVLGPKALPRNEEASPILAIHALGQPASESRLVPRDRVVPERIVKPGGMVYREFVSAFPTPRLGDTLIQLVADRIENGPTLTYETEVTTRLRSEARSKVGDRFDTFTKGDVLVEQGQLIGEEQLILLRLEHQERLSLLGQWRSIRRLGAILVGLAGAYGLLLLASGPRTKSSPPKASQPVLLCWILTLTLVVVRVSAGFEYNAVFIPLAFTSLMLGLIYDASRAGVACMVLCLIASVAVGGGLEHLAVSVLGCLIGVHILAYNNRPNVALAGLFAAAGIACSTWVLGLVLDRTPEIIRIDSFWRAGFTLLTGLSLSGILALTESFRLFRATSVVNRSR